MRWRRRLEPWGSHQEEARVLKWETSVALTELPGWPLLKVLEVLEVESVLWARAECVVLTAARSEDWFTSSLLKGAGNERRAFGRILFDLVKSPALHCTCGRPAWKSRQPGPSSASFERPADHKYYVVLTYQQTILLTLSRAVICETHEYDYSPRQMLALAGEC
jgi:hypothetical protein